MRTYPSFFSQGGLEGVTWVCSYPVWKLYMHDLLFHPVLNAWDGEDDCFEFCLGGNFAMPWGGSERDLKSKQTLDNWRNCNSTLFNARPKTSWKSCQSSWRNWRSRPSTRQVGRLQNGNSKLAIGQKSLDNMSLGFQCDCLRYIFPPLLILRLECNIQSIFMKTNLILLVAEDGSVQSYWWQP